MSMKPHAVKLHIVRPQFATPDARRASDTIGSALTLAAMSLGYGVVQLDVTIVSTPRCGVVRFTDRPVRQLHRQRAYRRWGFRPGCWWYWVL